MVNMEGLKDPGMSPLSPIFLVSPAFRASSASHRITIGKRNKSSSACQHRARSRGAPFEPQDCRRIKANPQHSRGANDRWSQTLLYFIASTDTPSHNQWLYLVRRFTHPALYEVNTRMQPSCQPTMPTTPTLPMLRARTTITFGASCPLPQFHPSSLSMQVSKSVFKTSPLPTLTSHSTSAGTPSSSPMKSSFPYVLSDPHSRYPRRPTRTYPQPTRSKKPLPSLPYSTVIQFPIGDHPRPDRGETVLSAFSWDTNVLLPRGRTGVLLRMVGIIHPTSPSSSVDSLLEFQLQGPPSCSSIESCSSGKDCGALLPSVRQDLVSLARGHSAPAGSGMANTTTTILMEMGSTTARAEHPTLYEAQVQTHRLTQCPPRQLGVSLVLRSGCVARGRVLPQTAREGGFVPGEGSVSGGTTGPGGLRHFDWHASRLDIDNYSESTLGLWSISGKLNEETRKCQGQVKPCIVGHFSVAYARGPRVWNTRHIAGGKVHPSRQLDVTSLAAV